MRGGGSGAIRLYINRALAAFGRDTDGCSLAITSLIPAVHSTVEIAMDVLQQRFSPRFPYFI
jgi:hypothetical protein